MHPLFLHIQAILWRFWKWLLHFLTGKCELYRLVAQATPVQIKARRVEQSLRNSRSQNLRSIVMSPSMDPSEATDIIVREKKIKTISSNDQFLEQLQPVLVRVRGVRLLWSEVEQLRAESYRQDNKEHEDMLLELWRYLQPNTPLESRITKQWQNIGFQGDNPATDFRGMGVLSLHCMLYFAEKYQSHARSVLSHSHHPQYDYPFAMVAIDLTGVAFKWLENGTLNYYHYTVATHWPLPLEQFMEIVCYLLVEFDKFWLSKEPENVMAFPRLRSEFVDQLSRKLKQDNITVLLQIHQ